MRKTAIPNNYPYESSVFYVALQYSTSGLLIEEVATANEENKGPMDNIDSVSSRPHSQDRMVIIVGQEMVLQHYYSCRLHDGTNYSG